MSVLKVEALQHPDALQPNVEFDNKGFVLFDNGFGKRAKAAFCRAWVVFQGTGTVSIFKSRNVSSITDNAVGDYTVNFTTPMPYIRFATHVTNQQFATGGMQSGSNVFGGVANQPPAKDYVRVYAHAGNVNANYDAYRMNVAVIA